VANTDLSREEDEVDSCYVTLKKTGGPFSSVGNGGPRRLKVGDEKTIKQI
jgi:hypothetical protein